VVPAIHRIARAFGHAVLTQDWHPQDHHSFASNHPGRAPFETVETSHGHQVLWPTTASKEAWARRSTLTFSWTMQS
jgi:nicotinamidase/pyrazinamidase